MPRLLQHTISTFLPLRSDKPVIKSMVGVSNFLVFISRGCSKPYGCWLTSLTHWQTSQPETKPFTSLSFRGILVLLLKVLPFCTLGEERVSKAPRREAPQAGLGWQMRGGRGRAQRASRCPRGGRVRRAPQRVLVSSSGTLVL